VRRIIGKIEAAKVLFVDVRCSKESGKFHLRKHANEAESRVARALVTVSSNAWAFLFKVNFWVSTNRRTVEYDGYTP